MSVIKKIKLLNFKRFKSLSINLDEKINILIGDNEAGKSTILTAIDIVLSGSRNKVETIGLDSVFNNEAVSSFLASDKKYENLPIVFIELFLDEQNDPDLNGKINSDEIECDGLRLVIEPNELLSKEINEILRDPEQNFPFEYYTVNFKTFSGDSFTGYRKFLRHVFIDSSQISNEYATRDYIKTLYESNVHDAEKSKHQNEYRRSKEEFKRKVFADLNTKLIDYSFSIKSGSKSCLETDLTISQDEINIENKGKGQQCFIKTDFALRKKVGDHEIDIVLLEEPENHLSHINMKKLIRRISETKCNQLLISTHSNLIATGLDLRKAILLNSNSLVPASLNNLPDDTATFFMKSSNHNVLEFILSKKVILVEEDSEYILLGEFYKNIIGKTAEESNIHIISIGGTSFKRYLDLAKLLNIKTAVIRDNDHDYYANCIENYNDYINDHIMVFSEEDNERYTFEVALYIYNPVLCNDILGGKRKTLTVQEYMLKNKTEVAFDLLRNGSEKINPPSYIRGAIAWISE